MSSGNSKNYRGRKAQGSARSSSGAHSSSSAPMASLNWRERPAAAGKVDLERLKSSPADDVAVVSPESKSDRSSTGKQKLADSQEAVTAGGFVVGGAAARQDDVFKTPSYKTPFHRGDSARSVEGTSREKGRGYRITDNWRKADGKSGSPTKRSAMDELGNLTQIDMGKVNRPPVRITSANAQLVLPPSACIFVANLAQSADDKVIEAGVQEYFKSYGIVYIKIRRDVAGMPFAFCQYTNPDDAQRAMREGQGAMINGRPVRVEPARANRTFYLTRFDFGIVTREEAIAVLVKHEISGQTWFATPMEMRQYHIKDGIFIEFEMYDAGHTLQTKLQRAGVYRLEQIKTVENAAKRAEQLAHTRAQRTLATLADYETDRNSIFVGNIPEYFNDENLRALFSPYGPVLDTTLLRNASTQNRDRPYLHGFVEFDSPYAVTAAIAAMHGSSVGEYVLKVNNKDSDLKNGRKIQRNNFHIRQPYRSNPVAPTYTEHRIAQPSQPIEVGPQRPELNNVIYPTPAYSHGYVYPPNQHYPVGPAFHPGWNGPPAFASPYAPPTYAPAPYPSFAYGTPAPNQYYGPHGYGFDYNMGQYPADYYHAYATPAVPIETIPEEPLAAVEESPEEENAAQQ